jgi:uncharacterized protein YbaR (Trm112 family)
VLAQRNREEEMRVVSVVLVVPLDKESLTTHKDQIGDQETELPLVDNQTLRYKVSDEVVRLLVAAKLRLLEPAQPNRSNNQDQSLQKMSEPDLGPLKLVLLVLTSHLPNNKVALVGTRLVPPSHTHLSDGRPSRLIGKA